MNDNALPGSPARMGGRLHILYRNGQALTSLPLRERKKFLSIMKEASMLPIFFIKGKGKTFFESVTSMGYEDIMAKRMELFTFTAETARAQRDYLQNRFLAALAALIAQTCLRPARRDYAQAGVPQTSPFCWGSCYALPVLRSPVRWDEGRMRCALCCFSWGRVGGENPPSSPSSLSGKERCNLG